MHYPTAMRDELVAVFSSRSSTPLLEEMERRFDSWTQLREFAVKLKVESPMHGTELERILDGVSENE